MTSLPTNVVTCFVARGKEILLLRRSQQVGTYRGRWSGVSGYLETADPEEQAWTELREEVGGTPDQLTLCQKGPPLLIKDETLGRTWRVHPFRFAAKDGFEPELDWENLEARWVTPDRLSVMSTVPGLSAAWERVSE
jgi:8-oxo-dGTP diphosphatase